MMESDTGKELGKEALETVREIFRTTRSSAIIKELKKGEALHEPGTETESAADHEGPPQPDEAALSEH
jgi:hypothetical protein